MAYHWKFSVVGLSICLAITYLGSHILPRTYSNGQTVQKIFSRNLSYLWSDSTTGYLGLVRDMPAKNIHASVSSLQNTSNDVQTFSRMSEMALNSNFRRTCTQEERFLQLRQACGTDGNRYNLDVRKAELYVVHKLKIAACIPPKQGTTTLKTMIARLLISQGGGKVKFPKQELQLHKPSFLNKVGITVEKYNEIRHKNYYKFMTAREPFSKLASGRKDKLTTRATQKKEPYFIMMRDKMIRILRGNHSLDLNPNVTMTELIQYMHSTYPNNADLHWNGYAEACNPCHINYDAIIKMETFDTDIQLVLHRIPTDKVPVLNTSGGKLLDAHQMDLTADYGDVPTHLMQKLSQKFTPEQEMFGYRFNITSLKNVCEIRTKTGDVCC